MQNSLRMNTMTVNFFFWNLLRISDPQDLPAKTSNESGRLVHWLVFGNGNVCRLVDALPILDLKNKTNTVTMI